jgi:hypothetical protein
MVLLDVLGAHGKKRLTIHEVTVAFREAFPEHAQAPDVRSRVLTALRELEGDGVLELPKRGRGWDHSGRPALPGTVLLKVSATATEPERRDAWVPELSFAPTVANRSRLEVLRRINAFLIRRRGSLLVPVPVAERSLEIFADEKRLQKLIQPDGTLFERRLSLEVLGAYQVKPPLVHEASESALTGCPLLIIENVATFESFRRWNRKVGAYSSVVLGNGNSLSQWHVSLDDLASELGTSSLFYFGDLDPHGIEIIWNVNRARIDSGVPLLAPHAPLYSWLLKHGVRRAGNTKILPKHRPIVEEVFEPSMACQVMELWASGKIVPQESYGTEQLLLQASAALSPANVAGSRK